MQSYKAYMTLAVTNVSTGHFAGNFILAKLISRSETACTLLCAFDSDVGFERAFAHKSVHEIRC